MKITPEMLSSVPFQYAQDVLDGKIVTGKRIKQAVQRFYKWIDEADTSGFYLDHKAGMFVVNFFPMFINHTTGKMQGKPFHLAPFQAFTMYNVFAWKKMTGSKPDKANDLRRIKTVYDKRAKKNGKSAEMAGLSLVMLSVDAESEAQVYVGATKEDQARICWKQAKSFIDSHVANPMLRRLGFFTQQRVIGFSGTNSVMMALGGDSKTQDGINAHLAIIDEYHAHKDDSVKENLESSMVMRSQPIVWHITTAGTNVQSACKRYEDSVIEVLEGRAKDLDHLFIMIHDLDAGDDWEDQNNWIKANPLLGHGLELKGIMEEYENAKLQLSKIPNFKTKHLNMWVDAPKIWIPNEIWQQNKHTLKENEVLEKFQKFGGYVGLDLSTKLDISAYVLLSEPDENMDRYVVPWFFCPKDNIDVRSKNDGVPYRYWTDEGFITATPGNVIDYDYIEDTIKATYKKYNIDRIEIDPWNACQMTTNLMNQGVNVSEFEQGIGKISGPTKEFERLVYSGKIKHDGNPILEWMLAGCQIYRDANDNMKVHKGQSNVNGRRIDGIIAIINALGGSLSPPEDTNESIYNNPDVPFEC
jgi:phage terminase large subunit-like protein